MSPTDTPDPSVATPGPSTSLAAQGIGILNPVKTDLKLDSLTKFRTYWLRAIAKVWAEGNTTTFKADLLNDPIETLRGQLNFEWPWDESLELTVKEMKSDEFVWIGDDWAWPSDPSKMEGLKLRVPLTPPGPPEVQAIALMEYYQARPSLLSDDPDDLPSALLKSSAFQFNDAIANIIESPTFPSFPSFTGPAPIKNNAFIPSPISFFDFQVALISIIAKAWENKDFAALIQKKGNANRALNSARGYAQPWCLNLSIEDSKSEWSATTGWDKQKLGKHALELNLPNAPANVTQRAIALASYNSTGIEFPFSCCA